MQLRDYQKDIVKRGIDIIADHQLLYLQMEVRTGKTLTALAICEELGAASVLFITKKKAISSIINDYENYGFDFYINVINNESLHKVEGEYDIVVSDEHHRNASFPKPNKSAKIIKQRWANLPMIFLSGTPNAESYSQVYHQYWLSNNSPFNQWPNFYKWAQHFVNITTRNFGYADVKDYSQADYAKIKPLIDKHIITYTQKEAGFESNVNEHILHCDMKPITLQIINQLKKDKIVQGHNGVIIADTAVKLQNKIHQLCSGTCILEDGTTAIIDHSKAEFIRDKFQGKKIGMFYKFKGELQILKDIFGDSLCTELDEFNGTDKNIALQIISGREGISLREADALVYYNIDFSSISYFQSKDRMTTMDRQANDVYWVFARKGIEAKIYKNVINKKDYTLSMFKRDFFEVSK
tara:strand:+ start:157 stop:1386 length:1230 start_codon:yes stop_codon:yes gene_type:complete